MTSQQKFRRGAERLLDYLADEYDASGASKSATDNVQYYYKMPTVFTVGNRRALAMRTLEAFTSRFLKLGRLTLVNDPIAEPWSAYLAGWAAWGSGQLGRFDLARDIMAGVLDRQNATHGGFEHQTPHGRVQDTERSSAAAMGCIWSMNLPPAARVAAFLEHALEQQPEPGGFYAYLDATGQVVRDKTDRNVYFAMDDKHARPALFAASVACLVWLARTTGDGRYVELAHRYMKLVLAHCRDAARLPLATKSGWCALLVAAHVRDEALTSFAERTGRAILDRQQADGSIDFSDVPDVPNPLDKVWSIGWGCDCALTLVALADGGA